MEKVKNWMIVFAVAVTMVGAVIEVRQSLDHHAEKVAIQIDTSKLDFSSITKKMESIEKVTKAISNPLNIKWGKRV